MPWRASDWIYSHSELEFEPGPHSRGMSRLPGRPALEEGTILAVRKPRSKVDARLNARQRIHHRINRPMAAVTAALAANLPGTWLQASNLVPPCMLRLAEAWPVSGTRKIPSLRSTNRDRRRLCR